jgi:hypothetical protein
MTIAVHAIQNHTRFCRKTLICQGQYSNFLISGPTMCESALLVYHRQPVNRQPVNPSVTQKYWAGWHAWRGTRWCPQGWRSDRNLEANQ